MLILFLLQNETKETYFIIFKYLIGLLKYNNYNLILLKVIDTKHQNHNSTQAASANSTPPTATAQNNLFNRANSLNTNMSTRGGAEAGNNADIDEGLYSRQL